MKKICFLILFSLLYSGISFCQEISVSKQEIPAQGQFAQPFDVRFEITHTPGYEVVLDTQSLPDGFSLAHSADEALSAQLQAYDLSFLPFTLGISTFTAVNFSLKDGAGQTVTQTATTPAQVEIAPVNLFKDKKMRDIRPPYIPYNWLGWMMFALFLILLIYFLRRFWRKKHPHYTMQETPDLRPADVIALDKIQQLLQCGLWEKAQYKLFYTELGNILQEYLWRRFQLDVSADTSAELLRHIRKLPELAPLQAELRTYLNSSDLVKFAKVIPAETTMQQDVSRVRKVVEITAPRPEPTNKQKQEVR